MMLSVAEAFQRVTAGFHALAPEQIPVSSGLGRVLAEPVAARLTQPPLAVSAMDGYAVRAADLDPIPARLSIVGISAAGNGYAGRIEPGQAVRIFTGAPVPDGADAIVIQEDTQSDGETVEIFETAAPGAFVRPAGLDFTAGDALLPVGHVLSARDLGLIAGMNVPWIKVRQRPRVAILATGDELAMPGEPLTSERIISSNSVALSASVSVLGGVPVDLGIARDDAGALERMLEGARGNDLLVTIGGASVGDRDLVRKVLGDKGFELDFFRVAMRPGKPLIFGHLDGTPVIGLPGNPVSAGVTAMLFVRAALRIMLGLPAAEEPETAELGRDLPANDRREDYMRATLKQTRDGRRVATPFKRQDSAMSALFAQAECLVVRPPFAAEAKKGDTVVIIPFPHALARY